MSIYDDVEQSTKKSGQKLTNTVKSAIKDRKKTRKILSTIKKVVSLLLKLAAQLLSFIMANLVWIAIMAIVMLIVVFVLDLFSNRVDNQYYYKTTISTEDVDSIKNIYSGVYYEGYSDKSFYYSVEPVEEEEYTKVKKYLAANNLNSINEKVQSTNDGQIIQSGSRTSNLNYDEVIDIDNLEENIKLSFGTLALLDSEVNDGYIYPSQFIKPIYSTCVVNNDYSFDSIKNCKILTNEMDNSESTKYKITYTDGVVDSAGLYNKKLEEEKQNNMSEYGLGSIVLYNSYIQPSRIVNNKINYLKYQNPAWTPNNGEKLWLTYGGSYDSVVSPSVIKDIEQSFNSNKIQYANRKLVNESGEFTEVASEITYNNYIGKDKTGSGGKFRNNDLYYETQNAKDRVDNPPIEETIEYAITKAITAFGTVDFDIKQEWQKVSDSNAVNTFYTLKEYTGNNNKYHWVKVSEDTEYSGGAREGDTEYTFTTVEYELQLKPGNKEFNEDDVNLYLKINDENLKPKNITATYLLTKIQEYEAVYRRDVIIVPGGVPTYEIHLDHYEAKTPKYRADIEAYGTNPFGSTIDWSYSKNGNISFAEMISNSRFQVAAEEYVFKNTQKMNGDLQYYLVRHEDVKTSDNGTTYLENYLADYTTYIPMTDSINTIDSATGVATNTDGQEGRYCVYSQEDFDKRILISPTVLDVRECAFGVNEWTDYGYTCKGNYLKKIRTVNDIEVDYIKNVNENGGCDQDYKEIYYDGTAGVLIDKYNAALNSVNDISKVTAGKTLYSDKGEFLNLGNKTNVELMAYGELLGYKERVDGSFSLANLDGFNIDDINNKEKNNELTKFLNSNRDYISHISNQFGVDEDLVGTIVYYILSQTNSQNIKLEEQQIQEMYTSFSNKVTLKEIYHLTGTNVNILGLNIGSGISTSVTLDRSKMNNNDFHISYIAAKLSQGMSYFRVNNKTNTLMAIAHVLYDMDNAKLENSLVYQAVKAYANDYYYDVNSIIEDTSDIAWLHYLTEVINNPENYNDVEKLSNGRESHIVNLLKLMDKSYINILPSANLSKKHYKVITFNSSDLTDKLSEALDENGEIVKDKYYQILVEQGYKHLKASDSYDSLWYGMTDGFELPYVNGIWAENNEMLVAEREPEIAYKIHKYISDLDIDRIIKGVYTINTDEKFYSLDFGSENYWKSNFGSILGSSTSKSYFGYDSEVIFGDVALQNPLHDFDIEYYWGNNWYNDQLIQSDSVDMIAKSDQNVFAITEGIVESVSQKVDGKYVVIINHTDNIAPENRIYQDVYTVYDGLDEVYVNKNDLISMSQDENTDTTSIIGNIKQGNTIKISGQTEEGSFDYDALIKFYFSKRNKLFLQVFNASYATLIGEKNYFDKEAFWNMVDDPSLDWEYNGQCVRSVNYYLKQMGLPLHGGDGVQMATNAINSGDYYSWNSNPEKLKAGSIVSIDTGTIYGHVFIINEVSVDEKKVCIIDANVANFDSNYSHGDAYSACYEMNSFGGIYGGNIKDIAVPK